MVSQTEDFTGTTIANRFHIESIIAEGATSVVYRAKHLNLDQTVAIKILKSNNPSLIQRFEQEAQILSGLEHKNLVKVLAFGSFDDPQQARRTYMVMELLEGKSLKTILQEEKTISNQLVAAIAREICDALSAVHDKGIVHRDLKPANIIIINSNIENAELKLIDFGHLIT